VNTRFLFAFGIAVGITALTHASAQATSQADITGPMYAPMITTRTIEAVSYQHRSGATKVDFAGTALMSGAAGHADVKSNRGSIAIEAEFVDLQKPTAFGGEYLTYVLWAISPEGAPVNLGEVLVGGNHRSKLEVTTVLQAFAMIVTAEPYYAVRQPSNVVVLENVVRSDTKGSSESVNARYELMERGGYIPTGYKFDPVVLDAKLPLEFLEARNALRIAQSEGAEKYAGESYQRAVQLMNQADQYAVEKHASRKELIATSREAVQTAEDARGIAVKAMDQDYREAERLASADKQQKTQATADDATRQKEQAQAETALAQADAASSKARADEATRQKEAGVVKAQADAAYSQAQVDDAIRQKELAEGDALKAKSDLVVHQSASDVEISAAHEDADQARASAKTAQQNERQSDSEKAVLRAQLSDRLNEILQTRDSARGLIVSMSDVLFDSGKFSLNPGAREKLAKVAGILISYPALVIEVGGYTDNVGKDDMNQVLSQSRAGAVRDYLVQQGVNSASVTSKGFGNMSPVASNNSAAGRQENRRVELVVSGEAIGVPSNRTTGSLR